jgi:transposase-like protein
MFTPPRCPYPSCNQHRFPKPGFYRRHGFYEPKCRSYPVPRFRCMDCLRTFSRQTFRADYRDHKPDRNAWTVHLLCSGIGYRQTARLLQINLKSLYRKSRKIGRHCKALNANLIQPLPEDSVLQFDELETYEGRRNTRPLTLGVVIQRQTRLILGIRSAPIRPSGSMPKARKKAYDADTARFGKRQTRSRALCRNVLRRAARSCPGDWPVLVETDEKTSYPKLLREVFGERLVHERTPSTRIRSTHNPLFPINHTEAIARDHLGRLRRESWLASKRRWYLNLHLHMYAACRNFTRPRYNYDSKTPAQLAGWTKERYRMHQLLGWRQDWGVRSGDPLSRHAAPLGG